MVRRSGSNQIVDYKINEEIIKISQQLVRIIM
jgi:hypothetical protein